ncbi:MAG TPA: hypothetical protein VLA16_23130, partial [Ideonella sp.]|nr:hypothetical protein [Ideonella sp.]
AIMGRANAGHGWHVAGAELQALHEALVIYAAQVELCSYGEFLNAHELVRRRVSQAIARGKAGQVGGCVVHSRPHPAAAADSAPASQEQI